jgi:hypothetical protein
MNALVLHKLLEGKHITILSIVLAVLITALIISFAAYIYSKR